MGHLCRPHIADPVSHRRSPPSPSPIHAASHHSQPPRVTVTVGRA
uniref:Uncharacterized protein n=1 Tax=Arundo donax TaxID=35708 RepID=A0A0A9GWU1_ARUDO